MTHVSQKQKDIPGGAAAAAVLSAGLGSFAIGVCVVAAQAYPKVKVLLTWYPPAGPLSGKTGAGVVIWLASWALLHRLWKDREAAFSRAWLAALALILLANLLAFPPVYEAFGH